MGFLLLTPQSRICEKKFSRGSWLTKAVFKLLNPRSMSLFHSNLKPCRVNLKFFKVGGCLLTGFFVFGSTNLISEISWYASSKNCKWKLESVKRVRYSLCGSCLTFPLNASVSLFPKNKSFRCFFLP